MRTSVEDGRVFLHLGNYVFEIVVPPIAAEADPAGSAAHLAGFLLEELKGETHAGPYGAYTADNFGWCTPVEEALEHLRTHHPADDGCDDCPEQAVVVTGTAMPSEEGRLRGSYHTVDLVVEYDDLDSMGVADAITRIEQAALIANALNALAEA